MIRGFQDARVCNRYCICNSVIRIRGLSLKDTNEVPVPSCSQVSSIKSGFKLAHSLICKEKKSNKKRNRIFALESKCNCEWARRPIWHIHWCSLYTDSLILKRG